jgi:hydroxymethylpyrimidine kinase/phosphomethylpyrimidine kinase
MMASKGAVEVVAEYIQSYGVERSVVDPVMVSTSGAELLPQDAIEKMLKQLLPLTYILTPNIPEAKLLLTEAGESFEEPHDVQSMVKLAKAIRNLGPQYVLLKGGHLPLSECVGSSNGPTTRRTIVNILQGPDEEPQCFRTQHIESSNTHGTGCSLACRRSISLRNFQVLRTDTCSCHCIQPCSWFRCFYGSKERQLLRGSWDQN